MFSVQVYTVYRDQGSMLYKLVWFVQHATPINKWLIFYIYLYHHSNRNIGGKVGGLVLQNE